MDVDETEGTLPGDPFNVLLSTSSYVIWILTNQLGRPPIDISISKTGIIYYVVRPVKGALLIKHH